ncbi:MAG: hypothetical protein ACOYMA_16415 [Bacteroidia bacterium]
MFLVLFSVNFSLFSQQNQAYKEGYTYFFLRDSFYDAGIMKSSYSSLIPISVIKTEVNKSGNLSYIFNKTVNTKFENDFKCFKKNLVSNIGSSLNYIPNGVFFTINQFNDTIYFKTKDTIGSSWNLFVNNSQYPEIKRVNIQIKSITIDSVLGELDTIITYKYLPYDSKDILLKTHEVYLNNSKFALNHGFIETLDLRAFPFSYSKIKLCGRMKNDFTEKIGITGIWNHQINDKNVGDELEYTTNYFDYWLTGSIHNIKTQNRYSKLKVIEKTENDSQIIFKNYWQVRYYGELKKENEIINQWDSVRNDTSIQTIKKTYDTLAYIPTVFTNFDIGVRYYKTSNIYYELYNPEIAKPGVLRQNNDTCWGFWENDQPKGPDYFYYSGVGGFYSHGSNTPGKTNVELVYFKKGNITKGTPYPFALGAKNIQNINSNLVIYPNPANNEIRISNSNNNQEKFIVNIGVIDKK